MKRLALSVFDFAMGMLFLHTILVISVITYYWTLKTLIAADNGTFPGSVPVWLMLAPLIYVSWLIWFLAHCCLELYVHRFWLRFRKYPRMNPRDGFHHYLLFYAAIFLYLRMRFLYSLPIVNALITLPIVRHLVFRAYAIGDHVSHQSLVCGMLSDPDLTHIGEGAIIGAGASVIAHSITVNSDGSRVLVTVPISIGARSVVGGDAAVHFGVVIGVDAVIEPASYVPAMTHIGDGEVWGGNPARFLRKRTEPGPTPEEVDGGQQALLSPDNEMVLRSLVASSLHRPADSITEDFSRRDSAAWDSLAQLSMALSLQQNFGIQLSSQESFQLFSMSDLRDVLRRFGFS